MGPIVKHVWLLYFYSSILYHLGWFNQAFISMFLLTSKCRRNVFSANTKFAKFPTSKLEILLKHLFCLFIKWINNLALPRCWDQSRSGLEFMRGDLHFNFSLPILRYWTQWERNRHWWDQNGKPCITSSIKKNRWNSQREGATTPLSISLSISTTLHLSLSLYFFLSHTSLSLSLFLSFPYIPLSLSETTATILKHRLTFITNARHL